MPGYHESVKRAVFKLLVFLLLGAAVNVAVAWLFVWNDWFGRPLLLGMESAEADANWNRCTPPDWPRVGTTFAFRCKSFGTTIEGCSYQKNSTDEWSYTEWRIGLPLRSMSLRFLSDNAGNDKAEGVWRVRGVELPTIPLALGFAFNTLTYAAPIGFAWTVAVAQLRRVRRRRRIAADRCPSCGYPVGASLLCTECGKQVKPKQAEAVA